jgi:hypothetical protein
MSKLKWRYDVAGTYTESESIPIGCTVNTLASDLDGHNDSNCAYVSYAGSDSTGDGTYANPYRTVLHALDNLDSNQTIITILDSNEYYTGKSGQLTLPLAGVTLQGLNGQTPTLTIDTGVASQEYMIDLTYSAKLKNVKMTVPDGYGSQVTCVRLYSGTFQNVTIETATRDGISMPATSSSVVVNKCIIKNIINDGTTDGNGIRIVEGQLDIDRTLIVDCDRAGIYSTGSTSKTIDGDYVTIAGNQYGLYGHNSTNLSVNFQDSILYENTIYDYYYTSGTLSYICVGSINGAPTLSNTQIRFNPFFVGSGDYRLRTVYNGYADANFSSPVYGVSSEGKDLGCYLMERTVSTENYIEFDTERSDNYVLGTMLVEGKLYYTNTLHPKIVAKGEVDTLTIGWNIVTETEFNNLLNMYNRQTNVYLSENDGITFSVYFVDRTKGMRRTKPLDKEDMDLWKNIQLVLIKL